MKRFNKCRASRFRKERNETNDCGVVALSILGRMSYGDAHGYCKANRRLHGKGMLTSNLLNAARDAGLHVEGLGHLRQPNGCKYTPKTIGKKLIRGYYLCVTRGHFFSVVNGDVEDWSKGTKKHVLWVYKITKPKKVGV